MLMRFEIESIFSKRETYAKRTRFIFNILIVTKHICIMYYAVLFQNIQICVPCLAYPLRFNCFYVTFSIYILETKRSNSILAINGQDKQMQFCNANKNMAYTAKRFGTIFEFNAVYSSHFFFIEWIYLHQ